MSKTVVAVFRDGGDAQAAVADLLHTGFRKDRISMIRPDRQREAQASAEASQEADEAGAGAGTGAAIGGAAGLMLSLAALAIPGVGPILAAGPLVAALTGAGVGAAAGGLLGALTELGVPEREAHFYSGAIEKGGTLVIVEATPEFVEKAESILSRHGAVDIEERETATSQGVRTMDQERDRRTELPTVGDEGSPSHFGGEASRQTRITDIEATPVPDPSDEEFRRHYETTFKSKGSYDDFSHAYRFGSALGGEPRYSSRDWADVEADARSRWEAERPGTWESMKDAVRYAWDRVRTSV